MSAGPAASASRRRVLIGGVATSAAAVGAGAGLLAARSAPGLVGIESARAGEADPDRSAPGSDDSVSRASTTATHPFHGPHQAGIATPPAAKLLMIALDLREGVDRDGIVRMLRLLTDDAARLTAGRAPLADPEGELAQRPAGLTVTVGFGPRLAQRAGIDAPAWLKPLPAFGVDRLEPRWCDGDLLLQVSAEETQTVSHAARMLLKDARRWTTIRWRQQGFRSPAAPAVPSGSMRNLFGQVDGTANPRPGFDAFEQTVWIADGPWTGGTSLVVRRIRMDLDGWDELDRPGRELAMGRRLVDGAPLTGKAEMDEPDFAATSANGFPIIPEFSHVRAARGEAGGKPMQQIFRRAYNYDDPPSAPDELADSGLLFASFQADPVAQFVPIQERLDRVDLLNQWTTPVGSAVFAIPPGCAQGEFLGERLLG